MDSRKLLGTVLWTIFVLATSAAAVQGQNAPATDSVMTGQGEGSPPLFSQTAVEPSQGVNFGDPGFGQPASPRWTASAEFIILDRMGTANQSLVTTYPVAPPPKPSQLVVGSETERLNSNDLNQGFAGGPRLGLIGHGNGDYDLEFSFFGIDDWSNAKCIPPNGSSPVFTAPGDFLQTTDHANQGMAWSYATRLYNAELNVRWDLCPRVTMLAGFRWLNLGENLQGTLPPERSVPFWDTSTTNNLYGFQIGEDWKMLNRGCFSVNGLVKAGIFDNCANETTGVSIYRIVRWESASINEAAFVGEIGLQCKYQVTQRLSLKLGYEAIWLQNVASAPGQIQETLSHVTRPVNVQALGVDSGSGVFFHGATAGLEYGF